MSFESQVEVDAGYAGAQIVLYGAVFNPGDDPTDVVVVVRGPERPVRLVRKVRVAGLWLNSRPVLFEGAPAFYMTASSRPLSDIAGFGVLRRLGVGLDHIRIDAPAEQRTVNLYGVRDVVISRLGDDYLDWRRAVIRLKEAGGLYNADPTLDPTAERVAEISSIEQLEALDIGFSSSPLGSGGMRSKVVAAEMAAGDAVEIRPAAGAPRPIGKGIVNYSAAELKRIKGMKSNAVQEAIPRAAEEAVHRDYFVLD